MNTKFLLIVMLSFLLLGLSSVQAVPRIEFSSPSTSSKYNVGDQVTVDGSITLDRTLLGATVTFKLVSTVYNLTTPLAKKYYNFQKDVPATFSQINLGDLIWKIPSNTQVSNDWKIVIDVDKSPAYSTSFESGLFMVTKSLQLSPNVNSYLFNFGETLEATGTVLTARKAPVNGTGNILFEHRETGTVHSEKPDIKDGFIKLQYPFSKEDPAGIYTLTFKVTDSNGNVGFIVLTGINLSDELQLSCAIPKQEFLPGESFSVAGNLKNIHNKSLSRINVTAYLTPPSNGVSLNFVGTTNENGDYEIPILTPKLATPGQYSLRLIAADSDGNNGKCERNPFLNVIRELSVLFNLNSSWYYNESEIGNEVKITNKGNIDLIGKIALLVDNIEVASHDITVERGLEKTFSPFWIISTTQGVHNIKAVIKAQNEILYTSAEQQVTIFPKPPPKKILSPSALQTFIIIGIIVIAILAIVKKRELKDYWWHWELKRKYKIGK